LKSRLGWKSTCTPARRASNPRCMTCPVPARHLVPSLEPRRGKWALRYFSFTKAAKASA
jgi:hypothetical protein